MSSAQGAYASTNPFSRTPPPDLGTYSRSMHQHTKKQMEAASRSERRRSSLLANGVPARPTSGSGDSVLSEFGYYSR